MNSRPCHLYNTKIRHELCNCDVRKKLFFADFTRIVLAHFLVESVANIYLCLFAICHELSKQPS